MVDLAKKNIIPYYTNTTPLNRFFWDSFNLNGLNSVDLNKWKTIKLIYNKQMNPAITSLPNDKKGIYIFFLQSPIFVNCGAYIMYIGKAQRQSLKKRLLQYKKELGPSSERERIEELFSVWGDYVHIHYLFVDNVEEIEELETRLIRTFRPCCCVDMKAKRNNKGNAF